MILFNRSRRGSSNKATSPLLTLLVLFALSLNMVLCQNNQNLFQNTNDDEDQYDMMSENDNESSGNGQDDNNHGAQSDEEEAIKTQPKTKSDDSVKRPASNVNNKNPELEKKSQESQPKSPSPIQQQQQSVSKTDITQKDYDGDEYDQDQNNEYEQDDYGGTDGATNNKDSNKLDADNAENSDNTIMNNDPQITTTVGAPIDNSQYTYQSTGSKLLLMITKPGIMAGIIGGAIIGVLTAILLIMFIVYRMRKKDEGSYALEETKKPLNSYDYRNCPTREFYA